MCRKNARRNRLARDAYLTQTSETYRPRLRWQNSTPFAIAFFVDPADPPQVPKIENDPVAALCPLRLHSLSLSKHLFTLLKSLLKCLLKSFQLATLDFLPLSTTNEHTMSILSMLHVFPCTFCSLHHDQSGSNEETAWGVLETMYGAATD